MSVIADKFAEVMPTLSSEVIVLQYPKVGDSGGMKWTTKDIQVYGDALSAGLRELMFKPGDVVATKLKDDRPEKHCTLFAAAHGGFKHVAIDSAIDDPATLAKILADNNVRMFIYDAPDVDLIAKAIPEFGRYYAKFGTAFVGAGVPKLKWFITIDVDKQPASFNYQHILAYHQDQPPTPTQDDTPLLIDYKKDGTVKHYTHAEAVAAAPTLLPALDAVMKTKLHIFE